MSDSRWPGASRRLPVFLCLSLAALPAVAPAQTEWVSPLLGRELVIVEKTVSGDTEAQAFLPAAVEALLPEDFVDYETFVAASLPAEEAADLVKTALIEGRSVFEDPHLPVVLQHHTFEAANTAERNAAAWAGRSVQPDAVPNLFLVRFAFPFLPAWDGALRGCGIVPVLYYGNDVFLVRTENLAMIKACASVARYVSWADAFFTTDRLAPELLDAAGLELAPYVLTFAPGTTLDTALAQLPQVMEAGESMTMGDGTLVLGVLAGQPELEALVRTGKDLLSIDEASGPPELADERQGQIVAGNYNGYAQGALSGTVTTPGYLAWLDARRLRTPANQQTVAIFDTGYDDGTGVDGIHHPDLENPERLIGVENYMVSPATPEIEDRRGHGTMVAGIVAGDGTKSGKKDAQGFYYGTGIAPDVKLLPVQIMDSTSTCVPKHIFFDPPTRMGDAIAASRVTSTGADRALIVNHSWNLGSKDYDLMAQLFDQRVVDGAPSTAGPQGTTMIVAAGNNGINGQDTLLSPANAKNVIAVGSLQNYRPTTESGAPPSSCDPAAGLGPEFQNETTNIAKLSAFSSQGREFGARGQNKPLVTTQRIKPDLVAVGERVFSTVPDLTPGTYVCSRLCQKNWPAGDSHTYSSGTSFSAPVVTGVAALARKWFIDKGTANPSPSLLKAALIGTATDLGLEPSYADDHRPSYKYGWGRVNLERLTDSAARFYRTENLAKAIGTAGQEYTFNVTVASSSRDVTVTLVWSDPPSPTGANPPLVNDLRLTVERVGTPDYYRGNNFNENIGRQNNPSFPQEDEDGYSFKFSAPSPIVNDTMNTVEAVFIKAGTLPEGQKLIIRVTGVKVQVQTGAQKFALYGYNVR